MKLGIDGYNLALPRGTGVATYSRTLAEAIHGLGCSLDLLYGLQVPLKSREDTREALFFARLGEGEDGAQSLRPTLRRAILRALMTPEDRDMLRIPVSGRVLTHDFAQRIPAFDRLFTFGSLFNVSARYFRRFKRFMTVRVPDPPEIMHWTYPVPVRLRGALNVYTLHDLVPMRLPHTSLEDKSYYDAVIRQCLDTAAHIVTVSESSRRDIMALYGIDASQITNTYQPLNTPSLSVDPTALASRLERLFDLELHGYFLFFGAIEPKKNVGRLIEAYLSSGVQAPLVIVGAGGWKSDQELRLLRGAHGKMLSNAERIRMVDYLPRALLLELVTGARAVVAPSLYEGFGLPAAEALALGAPLITSNTSSMPEVVGSAAIMVDPYDVGALAAAIARIDGDSNLRAQLSAAGPAQAQNFSMDKYKERLSSLYFGLVESGKR
jgi:glycosyltransferase involved in cell wall biosynthesis